MVKIIGWSVRMSQKKTLPAKESGLRLPTIGDTPEPALCRCTLPSGPPTALSAGDFIGPWKNASSRGETRKKALRAN